MVSGLGPRRRMYSVFLSDSTCDWYTQKKVGGLYIMEVADRQTVLMYAT